MNITDDSYSASRVWAWNSLKDELSGCRNGYVLAISSEVLSETCCDALQKSFAALGYGNDAVTYLVATNESLQDSKLNRIVEAIDPGIVISTDSKATNRLAIAYRAQIKPDGTDRLFGRPLVCFSRMDDLMQDDAGHQKIWAALKTLPKI